jgi:hypothetical protein
MPSNHSKNGKSLSWDSAARSYDRLSQLHREIASIYAELAALKPVESAKRVVPINSKSGNLLGNILLTNGKVKVEVVSYLSIDNAPYSWLKNYLKSLAEKDETFRFILDEENHALKSIEIEGKITPDLARKLESALKWSFIRMGADADTASNEPEPVCKNSTEMQGHFSKAKEES